VHQVDAALARQQFAEQVRVGAVAPGAVRNARVRLGVATNSRTFENGAEARAISIGPPVASCDSGSKSFTGSYGSRGCSTTLLMCVSGSVSSTV
jgi:hypothetical protein